MKRGGSLGRWIVSKAVFFRRGVPRPMPSLAAINRLTLLKLDAIGDFVLSTAFLRRVEIARQWKHVTLVVRNPIAPLAKQQFPAWEVIELPRRDKAWKNVFRQAGVWQTLTRLPPADLLIDLRWARDYSDTVLASWVSAACKVAVAGQATRTVQQVPFDQEEHVYDQLLRAGEAYAFEPTDLAQSRLLAASILQEVWGPGKLLPRLNVTVSDRLNVRAKLSRQFGLESKERFAVVCPGAASKIREYPPAQLAEAVVRGLVAPRMTVLVAGTEEDRRTVGPFIQAANGRLKTIDIVNAFALPEHVALLSEASLVVTMETSHAHIAGALGTPAVVVIGGGHFGAFGPWGESSIFRWVHRPLECYHCSWSCRYPRPLCIDEIPPGRIAAEIRAVQDSAQAR